MKKVIEVLQYIIFAILFMVLLITYVYGIMNEDIKVKNYLLEQGYQVEDIEFERVKGIAYLNLYKSSEVVDIGGGEYVEYWVIKYSPIGMYTTLYVVEPYSSMDMPIISPVYSSGNNK